MNFNPGSLKSKIARFIILAIVVVTLEMGVIYVVDQLSRMKQREEKFITDSIKSASTMAFTVSSHLVASDYAHMNMMVSHFAKRSNRAYVAIIDTNKVIMAHSEEWKIGGKFDIPGVFKTEKIGDGVVRRYRAGEEFIDIAYPIKAGDLLLGEIRLGLDTNWIKENNRRIWGTISLFLMTALGTILLGFAAASAVARKITEPLSVLTKSAEAIGEGNYSGFVRIKSRDEIGLLANAFNRMIEDLAESRSRLVEKDYVDSIISTMKDALLVLTPKGFIRSANRTTLDLLGYAEDELIGRHFNLILDDLPSRTIAPGEFAKNDYTGGAEKIMISKDGRKIPVLLSLSILHGTNDVRGLVCVAKDITGRKKTEEALLKAVIMAEDEKAKTAGFLGAVADGVSVQDTDFKILYQNQIHKDLVGSHLGEHCYRAYRGNESVCPGCHLALSFKDGGMHSSEQSRVTPAGTRYLEIIASPLRDSKGVIIGGIEAIRDITERKEAAEKIVKLNLDLRRHADELERAYRDMESFSYAVSHDLKAPIRRIEGFSAILSNEYAGQLDDGAKGMLVRISENTKKMQQLIDDLFDFCRFSTREIQRSEIDTGRLVRDVYDELRPAAGERTINFEILALEPAYGDSSMIHQVFLNLLSNAIKFTRTTEEATIEVGGYNGNGKEDVFYVKDNGIGFDMQFSGKLFSLFQQIHVDKRFEGTGVGLVIVKKIIEKHGGRVWAEGRPDAGATFYFSLPKNSENNDL